MDRAKLEGRNIEIFNANISEKELNDITSGNCR